MANALNNWVQEHKNELLADKEKKESSGKKCRKLEAATTIINIKDITGVTEGKFQFNNAEGGKNDVSRFFYATGEYNDSDETTHPWLIPKSVHTEICDQMLEYGDKLQAVKITKKGTGKNTEYKVFPQLK